MAFLKIKWFGGDLDAIKFGVSRRPVYAVYDRRICWRRQILAKTRNSPNSPNIIARQNLLIYSIEQLKIDKLDSGHVWNAPVPSMVSTSEKAKIESCGWLRMAEEKHLKIADIQLCSLVMFN